MNETIQYYNNEIKSLTPSNSTMSPTSDPPTWLSPRSDDYLEFNDDILVEIDDEPSIYLKIGAAIWLMFIVFCFRKERELEIERELRQERRRARREARRLAREALQRRMDPKRRMKDIEDSMVTVVYTVDDHGEQQSAATSVQKDVLEKSDIEKAELEDDMGKTCSICLDEFVVGSELSWSRDLHCRHVFHKECLMPWLLKHDDCPVCRTELISDQEPIKTKSNDTSNDDDDDDEPSRHGAFQIVDGLVSYVRHSSLSMVFRSENERSVEESNSNDQDFEATSQNGQQEMRIAESDVVDLDNCQSRGSHNVRRRERHYRSLARGDDEERCHESEMIPPDLESPDQAIDEELDIENPTSSKRKLGRKKYRPIASASDVVESSEGIDDRFVISDGDD